MNNPSDHTYTKRTLSHVFQQIETSVDFLCLTALLTQGCNILKLLKSLLSMNVVSLNLKYNFYLLAQAFIHKISSGALCSEYFSRFGLGVSVI